MKFKYILLTGLITVLLSACSEDFLDRPSTSELTTGVFYQTPEDFETAVVGIYAPIREFYNVGGGANTGMAPHMHIGDYHSDNSRYYYNPNYRAVQEDAADFIPEPQLFSGWWNDFYEWIARSNQVLATIDAEGIEWDDATQKDNLKGQALFIRAFAYWWLAQMYGDAVIHTEPVSSVDEAAAPLEPRATVVQRVIDDATAAQGLLLNKANQQPGRVTSGTATMLLAEVAIWEDNFAEAESLLKSLSSQYSLMDDYSQCFDPAFKNNAESIFEIQYDNATSAYASAHFYSMLPIPISQDTVAFLTGASDAREITAGEGYLIPTPDLIAEYEDGDERFAETIRFTGSSDGNIAPAVVKYLAPHALHFQGNNNIPIWRYGEALLFLAEAINEQNDGRQTEAMGYLNMVRNRAGLEDASANSYEEVRDAILHERRVELAFEGDRFWDLVRFDILEETIAAYEAAIRADKEAYYLPESVPLSPQSFTDLRTKFQIPDAERTYNPAID